MGKIESNNWLRKMDLNHPLLIAGPCSAETEEQVMDIALQLKNSEVIIYRAGVWKPRTRPGNFEGVGVVALPWLQRVKKETGLLIAIEVANKNHVKLALNHNIDVLWIGARTTVNPFMVQEIADALKDTDKLVLVKNPVNPDLELWIGAIERLQKANIKNIGAIHRGFSTYGKSKYRNNPEWQIPIDFKNRLPDIPLICDPSHICGERTRLVDVSQTALNLQFDGLMVETHRDPNNAWSDAKQQITPNRLKEITKQLKVKKEYFETATSLKELNRLREQINTIDDSILNILSKRMKIAEKIGLEKKKKDVAILQTKRWNEIVSRSIEKGQDLNLSDEFILRLYKAIHQESINHQEAIIQKN